jgi:hypothetical protein
MTRIYQRKRLEEEEFSYQATKDGKVFISWNERRVKALSGAEARRFLQKIEELDDSDAQLLMAKLTGNFKRGNERREKVLGGE